MLKRFSTYSVVFLVLTACTGAANPHFASGAEETAVSSEAEASGATQPSRSSQRSVGTPIATLMDDPRLTQSACAMAGRLDEDGNCPGDFVHAEIYFGSAPSGPNHFRNTVALHIEATDSTGFVHESICSGSLVAPSFVLSARHCIESQPGGGGNQALDWEVKDVVFGLHEDAQKDPSQVRVTVDRCVEFGSSAYVKCQQSTPRPTDRDLILVRLASPAPTAPMRLAEDRWIDTASALIAVGFGLTEPQGPNHERKLGLKQYAEVPMVSPSCSGSKHGKPDSDQYGCIQGIELVAGLGEHQGAPAEDTCGGDSGGTGYVIDQTSAGRPQWPEDYFLAAATSRAIVGNGANPTWPFCGDGGVYVRTDTAVHTWLDSVVRAAGERISVGRR